MHACPAAAFVGFRKEPVGRRIPTGEPASHTGASWPGVAANPHRPDPRVFQVVSWDVKRQPASVRPEGCPAVAARHPGCGATGPARIYTALTNWSGCNRFRSHVHPIQHTGGLPMLIPGALRPHLPRVMFGAAWAMLATVSVHAQEQSGAAAPQEKIQEVVITGSRIARPDLARLQPTTVVGAETFDQRGYTDVGQALSELPAFGIESNSAVNQQNNFGIAQSFVDLFSLGSQRTLTLVNGRRFVSSSTASNFNGASPPGQQVDLNLIPTKLIDRIETVSVGGAPIYGADAIAGTVNIITKKNYEGLDVDAQAGVSDDKDAWNYR